MLYLIYFLTISLIAVALTAADKRAAIKGLWRVPEKVLFSLALLGGALPMYVTMRLTHHKTRHKRFMVGLPIIFILQLVLIYVYFFVLPAYLA